MPEYCFGCGTDNPQGLHLCFDEEEGGPVSAPVKLTWMHSGEPDIVHGGIQAVVLDEVMGRAVQRVLREEHGEGHTAVTASLELRYRRPFATETAGLARGRLDRVEWPSIFVVGELTDAADNVLTEATARWRVLD